MQSIELYSKKPQLSLRRLSMWRFRITLAILFLAASAVMSVVSAHQDAIFKISPSGEIKGIPAEFAQVTLIRDLDSSTVTIRVRFDQKQYTIPPCLSQLLVLGEGENVKATGSWWHDTTDFPPYLVIVFPLKSYDNGLVSGQEITFNLATGEIRQCSILRVDEQARAGFYIPIVLDTLCDSSELLQLNPIQIRDSTSAHEPADED